MKRLLAAVGLVGVAVLVVVLTASGSSNSAARSAAPAAKKSVTFIWSRSRSGSTSSTTRRTRAELAAADRRPVRLNLKPAHQGGAHAGTLEATCTVTRGGDQHQRYLLRSIRVQGGQIAGIAICRLSRRDSHRGGGRNRRLRRCVGQHRLGFPWRGATACSPTTLSPDLALAGPGGGAAARGCPRRTRGGDGYSMRSLRPRLKERLGRPGARIDSRDRTGKTP